MNRTTLAAAGTVTVVIALVVGVVLAARPGTAPTPAAAAPSPAAADVVVREESHRLSDAPAGSPVFVEFLDLECEACRAAYPLVESLRSEYGDRVQFVMRYFPIESHANAMNAALAVEAAARQDALEPMYQRMYETQAEWGEQRDSKAALFREFAADLGLDLATYDADVASPEVRARVERDRADGTALGVQGTPTFFLDGRLIQPRSEQELRDLLEQAVRS